MSLFKRLFTKNKREEPAGETPLQWIEPTANKWGIPLLDLRPLTQTMLSTSKDPQMAQNAVSYHAEDGTTFFGQKPVSSRIIQSNIPFVVDPVLEAGVLFTPNTMEHKWAIFFDGEFLIFVRSWLRGVFVTAKTEMLNSKLVVKEIHGEFTQNESPAFTTAVLNYLLISHVLNEFVPAPLPNDLINDINNAGLWAFSAYGNKAEVGVFDADLVPTSKAPLRSHSLLHIAVARNNIIDIERRVKQGANLNYLAGDGLAPLHWSIGPDSTASMEKLLQMGADPDVVSVQGATPMMNAVQANKMDFLKLLLNAGASVNATDNRGFTALHRAAEMGHEEMIDVLLQHGADKTIKAESYTAMSLAEMRGNQKIMELLS